MFIATKFRNQSTLIKQLRTFTSVQTNEELIKSLLERSPLVLEESITQWKLQALSATLQRPTNFNYLPQGWHSVFCCPTVQTNNLGSDGYENELAPPAPYISRMWGGSILKWNKNTDQIKIGEVLQKKTNISNVKLTEGKKSGKLAILTINSDYSNLTKNQLLLNEKINMIYRTQPFANSNATAEVPQAPRELHLSPATLLQVANNHWRRSLIPSSLLLFRYSALTFNSHMIHYDLSYALNEGFNHILVHGPLQAQLIIDTVQLIFPDKFIEEFSYSGSFVSFYFYFLFFLIIMK